MEGIGTGLILEMKKLLSERGVREISGFVWDKNQLAMGLYERAGAKPTGADSVDMVGGCVVRRIEYKIPL